MQKKIAENKSYKKLREQVYGFSAIAKLYKLAKLFGFKDLKLEEEFKQLPDLKKQLKELTETPDLFNSYFSDRGWIAHESMNSTLIKDCLKLAKENKVDEAEQVLIAFYKNEDLTYHISGLRGIEAFKIRHPLILKAYEDFKSERYHASVPIILMMIDGVVDDIKKENKGFFAEGADLTAWDSLAGHETGLSYIAKIFSKSRKKTSSERIELPFRNGILHGKDLGYDNEIVATKVWATLFAVRDWAKTILDGKGVAPESERKLTIKESFKDFLEALDNYKKWQIEKKEIEKAQNDWSPRNFEKNDFDVHELSENTPEREVVHFFNNCLSKNYGLIAQQLDFYSRGKKSLKKLAGETREKFQEIEVIEYKLITVLDESPAISEVETTVTAKVNNEKELKRTLKFRMIYQDSNGNPLVRGNKLGRWYMLERTLWDFYNFEWIKS